MSSGFSKEFKCSKCQVLGIFELLPLGTVDLNTGSNPAMDQHLAQGRVKILLVTSCQELNAALRRPLAPIYADLHTNHGFHFLFITQCRSNIKKAFTTVDQLIAEKNFQKLEKDFSSCGDMSHPNDTWVFTQQLMTILDSIVQYNNQIPGTKNIKQVCQYMTDPSMTPYQGLVRLVQVRINVHFCIK